MGTHVTILEAVLMSIGVVFFYALIKTIVETFKSNDNE
jgi:hypothetical protein